MQKDAYFTHELDNNIKSAKSKIIRGAGCGVWGVGCGVWGVGCGVWGVGCGVWGAWYGLWVTGYKLSPFGRTLECGGSPVVIVEAASSRLNKRQNANMGWWFTSAMPSSRLNKRQDGASTMNFTAWEAA